MPVVQQVQVRHHKAGEPGRKTEEGKYQLAIQLQCPVRNTGQVQHAQQ